MNMIDTIDPKRCTSLCVFRKTREAIREEADRRGMKISSFVERMFENYLGQNIDQRGNE